MVGLAPAVLVVDGDVQSRQGIVATLERVGYRTRQAASGFEALEYAKAEPPLLVVLEINIPAPSGYEVCRELRDEFGDDLPIIFLSGNRNEPFDRVAGLLIGADDYIAKPFDSDELLVRVRKLTERSRQKEEAAGTTLTKRELEVLGLLAEGRTRSEIVELLVISPKTVSSHIERILMKLGVHSGAQAVAVAYRRRLVPADIADTEGP
jgi:DNA-binding NarL/FixJ family response regulator